MKLSGYMKLEAEPIKLRSLTRSLNSQQHKQLVFQIGETLESRPSLLRKIKVEPLEEDGLGEGPKPLHVEEEWTGPSSTSDQKPSLNNHILPAARLLPISVKLSPPTDNSPLPPDSLTHIPVEPSNNNLPSSVDKHSSPIGKLPAPTDQPLPSLEKYPAPTEKLKLRSDRSRVHTRRLSAHRDRLPQPVSKLSSPTDKLPPPSDRLLHPTDELPPTDAVDKLSHPVDKLTSTDELLPPSDKLPYPQDRFLPPQDKHSSSLGNFLPSTDKVSPTSDKPPPSPDKLPTSPDKVSPSPDKVPPSPDNLPPSPDKLPPSPDKLPPSPDKLSPSLNKLPPPSDKLPPSSSELPSASDKHPCSSDEFTPSSNKLSPSTDKLPSSEEELQPNSDKFPPSSDNLPFSPNKLPPTSDKLSPPLDELSPPPDEIPPFLDEFTSSAEQPLPHKDKLAPPIDEPTPPLDKVPGPSEKSLTSDKVPPLSVKLPSPDKLSPSPDRFSNFSDILQPTLDKLSPSPDKLQLSSDKSITPPNKDRSSVDKFTPPSDKHTSSNAPQPSPNRVTPPSDNLLPSIEKLQSSSDILSIPSDRLLSVDKHPLSTEEHFNPVAKFSPLSDNLSLPTDTLTTSSEDPEPLIYPTLPSYITHEESSLNVSSSSSVLSAGESAIANTSVKLECVDPQPDMVRLIQEPDSRIDSFCRKRSSRVAKRVSSVDIIEHLDLKNEFGGTRATRSCRSRRTSSRSDKSESEVSDSRSVAEETVHFDMVDKSGSKRGRPKNGEPPFEEANHHSTAAAAAKCNGEMSSETLNGVAKVKGRRISRTNSDESDASNGSKSNGLDHNGDKVDFSVLLEISVADRKKFEQKKSKRRRKTADWLLISETEQYYNEKEEIMRNKNKHDSDSDSDDSDEDNDRVVCKSEPQSESDSKHSDDSEDGALHPKRKKKRGPKNNRKHSGAADDGDDEEEPVTYKDKVSVRDTEENVSKNTTGRGKGGRCRKTLYDLSMLNVNEDDDDDDDDNFFGFPVSTTITASGTTGMSSSSSTHCSNMRSKGRNGKTKKRLSEAERFLRDNKEYYHFQETEERLRRTSHSDKSPDKTPDEKHSGRDIATEKELRETRRKGKSLKGDSCGRSLRSRTLELTKEDKDEKKEYSKEEEKEEEDFSEKEEEKFEDVDVRKVVADDLEREIIEKSEDFEKEIKTEENVDKMKILKEESDISHKELFCKEHIESSESASDASIKDRRSSDDSEGTDTSTRDSMTKTVDEMYFSFEGVPESESWYQTYQRFIDGIAVNEFVYDDDPLRFVLPYEMPRDVMKEITCRKSLTSKKKNDLSDLVRKSPRCHASTLALFSDILPPKRVKTIKVTRSSKIEEVSSDGTSTSGTDSTHPQSMDFSESFEEFAVIAHHMEMVMSDGKEDLEGVQCSIEAPSKEVEQFEDADHKKSVPRKRGKKKRPSKGEKDSELSMQIECKVFDNPLASEVDPQVLLSLGEDVKDLVPLNVLTQDPSEVVEDSWKCECTELISCDELSSIDDNTEASSECFSLCDSETVDGSVTSENRGRGGRTNKKRRVNLTGWPKTQKRKRSQPCRDETDGVLEDQQPKKRGKWQKNRDNHSLLEPLLSEDLSAMTSETERRASPRKKASVLYTDHFPLRVRTCK